MKNYMPVHVINTKKRYIMHGIQRYQKAGYENKVKFISPKNGKKFDTVDEAIAFAKNIKDINVYDPFSEDVILDKEYLTVIDINDNLDNVVKKFYQMPKQFRKVDDKIWEPKLDAVDMFAL